MKRTYQFLVAALYWFSLYTYTSYLPIHVQGIVNDLSLTGAILSMYGLVQMLIRLPLGIVSDMFGKRKPFIILGLITLGIGPILLSGSITASGLFIGRAITGYAAGTWVPLSAHIIDQSKKNIFVTTNILSFIGNLASVLAVLVAPLLTFFEHEITNTFWIASFSAIIALVIWIISTKGLCKNEMNKSERFVWNEIKNASVLSSGILFAIIQFGIFTTTFTFIPLLGEKFELPKEQFNFLLIFYFIVSIVTNFILNKVLDKKNRKFLAVLSLILLSIGILVTGFSRGFSHLLIAQLLVGISYGIGMPLFLGLAMSESKIGSRAISVGVFQSVYSIGMFSGPPVSTWFAESFGIKIMSIIIALFIILFATILLKLYKDKLFTY